MKKGVVFTIVIIETHFGECFAVVLDRSVERFGGDSGARNARVGSVRRASGN